VTSAQLTQLAIGILGSIAIWLIEDPRMAPYRRWASVVGLVGQIPWFFTLWGTEQTGILFLTFVYTAIWARSFIRYWIAPRRLRATA
jgi:hypothetical protein